MLLRMQVKVRDHLINAVERGALERVNFTLMGMVIDWVILMILLDQVVVKGRSLLNRWSVIIRELLLRLPWLLNLQLRPLLLLLMLWVSN